MHFDVLVCGLPIDFRWSVKLWVSEEQDGLILAPPFRPTFRYIKWTLPALACHTPAEDMIK